MKGDKVYVEMPCTDCLRFVRSAKAQERKLSRFDGAQDEAMKTSGTEVMTTFRNDWVICWTETGDAVPFFKQAVLFSSDGLPNQWYVARKAFGLEQPSFFINLK